MAGSSPPEKLPSASPRSCCQPAPSSSRHLRVAPGGRHDRDDGGGGGGGVGDPDNLILGLKSTILYVACLG